MAQLCVVLHPRADDSSPHTDADDKQLCYHVMGLVSVLDF